MLKYLQLNMTTGSDVINNPVLKELVQPLFFLLATYLTSLKPLARYL